MSEAMDTGNQPTESNKVGNEDNNIARKDDDEDETMTELKTSPEIMTTTTTIDTTPSSSSSFSSGDDKATSSNSNQEVEYGPQPAFTGIKKRNSHRKERNYRQSQEHLSGGGGGDSDDPDDDGDQTNKKKKTSNLTNESADEDNDSPPQAATTEPLFSCEDSNDSEWASLQNDDDDDSEDGDDMRRGRDDAASSMQRLFYQVRDVGNNDDEVEFEEVRGDSDSSSSSSSNPGVPLEEDDEDNGSSSSSDCVLEDLDEEGDTAVTGSNIETKKTSSDSEKPAPPRKIKKKYEMPKVLEKRPSPNNIWVGPREMLLREVGYRTNCQTQSAQIFRSKFYGSLHSVSRLELMNKLDGHHGCVNTLSWNFSGTRLASGSDDLFIKIWNYGLGKVISSFHSGHRANVFQAKFLPLISNDDTMIVSCARDNQVRLSELNTSGQVWSSRKLAAHRGPAHKLSVSPQNPHIVLSCGEDSVVYSIDVREDKAQRILALRDKGKKVALYSIHQNPLFHHEFCVSGRDEYVRIYDSRKLSSVSVTCPRGNDEAREGGTENDSTPLKKYCPHHLIDSNKRPNVTAAVYNYNGREIVATYNDDLIYLFNATHSDGADCIKVYEGHRNSATIKGVNFFGDKSQFVVSGSDCGHVFIWDKETESIVNFFRADENGVVNCLEPHPTSPILATSGLDDDVKIWIPSKEKDFNFINNRDLSSTVHKNIKTRKEELEREPESMDGRIIQALWNHIRQANRERRREAGLQQSDSDESVGMDDDDDDDDSSPPRGVECAIS